MLLRTFQGYKVATDKRRIPAPSYRVGQKVWLAARDLPLCVKCRKLALSFVGSFPVAKVVNRVAVRLRLPKPLRVNPTFHVSKIKPVRQCNLVPSPRAPPNARFINGGPAYTVKRLLKSRRRGWTTISGGLGGLLF